MELIDLSSSCECLVVIDNVGGQAIDQLSVKLQEKTKKEPKLSPYELVQPEPVFSWDASLLSAALSLLPGQNFTLPVKILGKTSS